MMYATSNINTTMVKNATATANVNPNINAKINSQIVKVFNDIFFKFVDLISNTFPHDIDITIAKNKLYAIKKLNPKMIIKIWRLHITEKYKDSIEAGDIDFFIEKNYNEDLNKMQNSERIMNCVNKLREPIKRMERNKQELTMKFIQDLTKVSQMIQIN